MRRVRSSRSTASSASSGTRVRESITSRERARASPSSTACVALLICFDLRYPELFRAVARDVDAIILIANWPAPRRAHWDALVTARAIENQCYMIAVNRTGAADALEYDGGSVVIGPWGERIAMAEANGVATATIDTDEVARIRGSFPVLG